MRILAIPKTLAVAAIYLVLTPLLHRVFLSGAKSIEGTPRLPLLVLMSVLSVGLLVVAFHFVKDRLPVRGSCAKGIVFTLVFYLVSVLVPGTVGMIAFDVEWQWLTPQKVGTYFTLLIDFLVYLVVGAAMGLLFPSGTSRRLPPTRRLALAAAAGGIVFPLAMWAAIRGAESALFRPLGLAVPEHTLWFALTSFGPYLLTGIRLPLMHLITRQARSGRGRGVLATTLVFALLWLPTQNFLVAFGWSFLPFFIASVVSIGPAALTIALAEVLMSREGSPVVTVATVP